MGVIFALFIKVALLDIFLGFLAGTLPKTWLACCQRVIVFKFCPWFSLCSYGILCNLCTPWLSLSQRYWLILDQYIGGLLVAISVNISADSWSISWLTLAVRLLVDMLAYRSSDSQLRVGWCVDQQISRLCWSLCWPIVRRLHSANTSLIRYNIILCLLKFLFCPWFSLCSYGILCNLCTSQLSIGQCYRPILDRHVGWDDGWLLVAISADSQLTWLTLVGWLSVNMLADGQIGGLCFFLLFHLFQRTTITVIITKHTCTHGLHT